MKLSHFILEYRWEKTNHNNANHLETILPPVLKSCNSLALPINACLVMEVGEVQNPIISPGCVHIPRIPLGSCQISSRILRQSGTQMKDAFPFITHSLVSLSVVHAVVGFFTGCQSSQLFSLYSSFHSPHPVWSCSHNTRLNTFCSA